jgi:hypothetical protein
MEEQEMELRRAASKRRAASGLFVALLCAAMVIAMPGRSAERSGKAFASAQIIQLLDGYVQQRFEEDNGLFGVERLAPPVNGHASIRYQLYARNKGEKEILHTVQASGYEYLVEFVHCSHVAGHRQNPPAALPVRTQVKGITLIAAKSTAMPCLPYELTKERDTFRKTTEERIKKTASSVIDRLARGRGVDTTVDGWQVSFRPVRASKTACLNCHAGAKTGDLLGAMAYAIRQPIKSSSGVMASK